jgi:hypothetical protein
MTVLEDSGSIFIESYLKITPDNPDNSDRFGAALAYLGDINGDGTIELAVGVPGAGKGEVRILSLYADASIESTQRIGQGLGGFTGELGTADKFGGQISAIGDINGDGVVDLAVGATNDDGPGNDFSNVGATWILFMNQDSTVSSFRKITKNDGGFSGALPSHSSFGSCATPLGDLDQNGFQDLMVGAAQGDTSNRGEAWVLFLGNEACLDEVEAP